MPHTTPMPGDKAPALKVATSDGGQLDLANDNPENFSLVFFYRGVHCPICKKQIGELAKRREEFRAKGFNVHAVSMDDETRVQRQQAEWDLAGMPVGYGLSEESAREWGLYISSKAQDSEPARFAEPGLVAVRPDGTIYAMWLQTVPFTRPSLDDLLGGLSFVVDKGYPTRGELAA